MIFFGSLPDTICIVRLQITRKCCFKSGQQSAARTAQNFVGYKKTEVSRFFDKSNIAKSITGLSPEPNWI